ncbi:hypothetical protein POSPLADRAFT_1047981 [Postia placenta MAD-698-R-SB12]|uniref:Uncharacterized protein n=1 Tax=Postia placenta MAD-698-R-SB12 TaxID=670580 RepID=A0A1X6MWF1_9APHY|nr:hypothetical protein POSPLADRAFT_1047981 [Postia placenta MAD-698-R-SB12]OSX60570.1 hypothetical protein POSPLADRAFT_1047981 [Postia placenta MAD-698-R-SB12]
MAPRTCARRHRTPSISALLEAPHITDTALVPAMKSGARTPRQPPVRTDAGTATRAVTMASPPPIQSKDARRDGAVRTEREDAPELDVDSAPHACPGQYPASNAPPDLPLCQSESRLAHLDSGPILAPWMEAPRYLDLPPHLCAAFPADTLCGRTRSPGTGTEDAGRHSRVPVGRPVCASAGRAARGDDRAVILGSRHAEKRTALPPCRLARAGRCRIAARARVSSKQRTRDKPRSEHRRTHACVRDCRRWASCVGAFAVRARATSLLGWGWGSPGGSRAHMAPTGAHRRADIDDARPAPACNPCAIGDRSLSKPGTDVDRLCIDPPGGAAASAYRRFATGPGTAGAARGTRHAAARAVRIESRGWCWTGLCETTNTCAHPKTAPAQHACSLGNGMLAAGADDCLRLYPHAPRVGREAAGAWLLMP